MKFYDAVKNRHSVRKYKSDPIPEDVLDRVLEAFRAAPSWANTQAWELVLVTDPEIKKQLQQTISDRNPSHNAIVDAPVIVCAIGIKEKSGYYKGQVTTEYGDWFMFDLGISTEHLVLAASAEGLGTVHVGLFDHAKAGEILEIPEGHALVELIPLGYPATDSRDVPRKPLSEFVFKNKYGQH